MIDTLERDPVALRRELDETQHEINSLLAQVGGYYKRIDTLAARINYLEDRTVILGEALIKAARSTHQKGSKKCAGL